jgi:hypothetical protein
MLEVMFGTLVLMISLLAAFTSQLLSLNLVRQARDSNTALSELTAAIEEVTTPNIDTIPTNFPPGAEIAKYDERVLRDESVVVAYPNYSGVGSKPNPLEVLVTIRWTRWNGRPATLSLSTLKAR